MRTRFVLAVPVAVMLSVLLAGCSSEQGPESSGDSRNGSDSGSAQSAVAGPRWSEYFPVRNGRVCTYSSSYMDEELNSFVRTVSTEEYTNVRGEPDGTHLTVKSTWEYTTTGGPGDNETSTLTTTPKSILADDGTLRPELTTLTRSGLFDTEKPGH